MTATQADEKFGMTYEKAQAILYSRAAYDSDTVRSAERRVAEWNTATHYTTEAGSLVVTQGGRSSVDFDWVEEPDACCDCLPNPYPVDGCVVWDCWSCGGGSARLTVVPPAEDPTWPRAVWLEFQFRWWLREIPRRIARRFRMCFRGDEVPF